MFNIPLLFCETCSYYNILSVPNNNWTSYGNLNLAKIVIYAVKHFISLLLLQPYQKTEFNVKSM